MYFQEQSGRNQARRFPAAERRQFDRENEQIHAGELATAFVTKPRTLLNFEVGQSSRFSKVRGL